METITERHARIVQLAQDTGCRNVLMDLLEAGTPNFDETEAQRRLNPELAALGLRIAVVVPNSRLAYLARMTFGDENHRIIYNDMVEAVLWLQGAESDPVGTSP